MNKRTKKATIGLLLFAIFVVAVYATYTYTSQVLYYQVSDVELTLEGEPAGGTSLTSPTKVLKDSTITLIATLTRDGNPMVGYTVTFKKSVNGVEFIIGSKITDDMGQASWEYTVAENDNDRLTFKAEAEV